MSEDRLSCRIGNALTTCYKGSSRACEALFTVAAGMPSKQCLEADDSKGETKDPIYVFAPIWSHRCQMALL